MYRNNLKNAYSKLMTTKSFYNVLKKRFLSAPNKLEVTVDGIKVNVDPGTTIIQAAKLAGVHIPRFCYHEKLSIAGNCRMCLVEVEKAPKPVAACAMPVMNGWNIKTNSEMAKNAREGVMEFLLINHPLDCPVCDQGGECDLQDQSMNFGSDRTRFIDNSFAGKRAVEDKDLGPLVKTVMTRCIHCTRCVRFISEIGGVETLGTTGRGNEMQIGTYVDKPILSELSGNLIDVCPVGALTSKPGEFTIRPWETKKVPTIDMSDAVGSNIMACVRGGQIFRIIPNPNDEINEDWISDKARFSFDGLKNQRIVSPMKRLDDGSYQEISWQAALFEIGRRWTSIRANNIIGLVGNMCDVESLVAFRDLFNSLDLEDYYLLDSHLPKLRSGVDFRCTYTMNNTIYNIEEADVILLVGTCPRFEAPLINARIRKSWMHHCQKIGVVGYKINCNYPVTYIGNSMESLQNLFSGKHEFSELLKNAKSPMIIMGSSTGDSLSRDEGPVVHNSVLNYSLNLQKNIQKVKPEWRAAGYVGALDVGYKPLDSLDSLASKRLVYLMGADSPNLKKEHFANDSLIIYQGHNGDYGASLADIILPGSSYLEQEGMYVNTEGRVQKALKVIGPNKDAKPDWKIVRAISEIIGNTLPYDDINALRARCLQIAPHLEKCGFIEETNFEDVALNINHMESVLQNKSYVLNPAIATFEDFYMTDSISRASKTMAKCVEMARKWENKKNESYYGGHQTV